MVWQRPWLLEGDGAGEVVRAGLKAAYRSQGLTPPAPQPRPSEEKAQLLFDLRKAHTGNPEDLLCAGGMLDLVRGSIECDTEEKVQKIYEKAMGYTIQTDYAEAVRVKNGFNKPAVGGYADLKLFLLVGDDTSADSSEHILHICELQVHLKDFLEMKQYTHLPYAIQRGDFDR